jgi:hypothetical protein
MAIFFLIDQQCGRIKNRLKGRDWSQFCPAHNLYIRQGFFRASCLDAWASRKIAYAIFRPAPPRKALLAKTRSRVHLPGLTTRDRLLRLFVSYTPYPLNVVEELCKAASPLVVIKIG